MHGHQTEIDAGAGSASSARLARPRLRRRRGRSRSASRPMTAAALRSARPSRRQTFTAPGLRERLRQRRCRGYYFTEYTPDAVRALAASAAGLKPVERISLLGDEWWMVRAGRHDIGVYLDLAGASPATRPPPSPTAIASRLAFTGRVYRLARAAAALCRSGFASGSARCWTRSGSLATRATATSGTAAVRSCSPSLALTGNDADVQRRARELARRIHRQPVVAAGHACARGAARGSARATRRCTIGTSRSSRSSAAQPEEYYRFFSALSVVPATRRSCSAR